MSRFHPTVWVPTAAWGISAFPDVQMARWSERNRAGLWGPWQHAPSGCLLCWQHCWLAGHTWVMPPVNSRIGRGRSCPTHLVAASDLLCALPTWLQSQIQSPIRRLKYKNTSFKRKRSWPGKAADTKLRLCSCMLIYRLWLISLYFEFLFLTGTGIQTGAQLCLMGNYLVLFNLSPL